MRKKQAKVTIGVGDIHAPFWHLPSIQKALEYIAYKKPDFVIQEGDIYDMFGASRFPKKLDLAPEQEITLGRICAEEFWKGVKKASPRTKCFQILGNHDDRPYKRLIERAPELSFFADFQSLWEFPGVETIFGSKDVLEVDGILHTHGIYTKLGDHLKNLEFQNVMHGHSHIGGVYYHRLHDGQIRWELDCGYLANPWDPALCYRSYNKYFKWTWGIGEVDEYGPRFIPFGVK